MSKKLEKSLNKCQRICQSKMYVFPYIHQYKNFMQKIGSVEVFNGYE